MRTAVVASILVVIAILLASLRAPEPTAAQRDRSPAERAATPPNGETTPHSARSTLPPAKRSERGPAAPKATHDPEQLARFRLPAVEIDGLDFRQALGRLMASYRDVCSETGETPLALHFDLPDSGLPNSMHLSLRAANLEDSLRFLANLAGLEMHREGTVFRFTPPPPLDGAYTRTFNLPPDIVTRLQELGMDPGFHDVDDFFDRAGRSLAEDSTVQFFPANSTLLLRSSDAGDMLAVEGMANWNRGALDGPVRIEATLLTLPSDHDLTLPDQRVLSAEESQQQLRELSSVQGTELFRFPEFRQDIGSPAPALYNALPVHSPELAAMSRTRTVLSRQGLQDSLAFHYQGNAEHPDLPAHSIFAVVQLQPSGIHWTTQTNPDGSRSILILTASPRDPPAPDP